MDSKLWCKWIYLQNINRLTDKTNLWLPKEKVWWYIRSLGLEDTDDCIWGKNKDLLCSTGNCIQYFIITDNRKDSKKSVIHSICVSILYMHTCKVYMLLLSHFRHACLCNPINCRLPGSSVHGCFQARVLEWVAMPSSRGNSWPRDQTGRFFTAEPLAKPS